MNPGEPREAIDQVIKTNPGKEVKQVNALKTEETKLKSFKTEKFNGQKQVKLAEPVKTNNQKQRLEQNEFGEKGFNQGQKGQFKLGEEDFNQERKDQFKLGEEDFNQEERKGQFKLGEEDFNQQERFKPGQQERLEQNE